MLLAHPAVFQSAYLERLHAGNLWRQRNYRGRSNLARKFKSHFGMDHTHCALLYNKIHQQTGGGLTWKPKHLLDALFFLKVYSSEGVGAHFASCDEKTLRKWNWIVIDAIASLECVSATHRFD